MKWVSLDAVSKLQIMQQLSDRAVTVREQIVALTKNHRMNEFTSQRIVQRLTEKDLIKIQKIMKKQPALPITAFLRVLRAIMLPAPDEDFYLTYGLFRLFQDACLQFRKTQITFNDFSTIITEKMPTANQELMLTEKLYPLGMDIPDAIKKKIFAPEVLGKVLEERQRLEERPHLVDKYLHLNRRVAQSLFSPANNCFFTIDYPSTEIRILDRRFEPLKSLQTELQISKRDAIVTWIAWSEQQQRLAALLGNYSISLWSKEDNFRYQVNVPLPLNRLTKPYVMVGYMESCGVWWGLDDHPTVYILSGYNFEPEHEFTHFKMVKEKETEKFQTVQLRYRKLLCLAFQRNVFLLSLEKRELITQLRSFKSSITSIAFSETYQALFVSTFDNSFASYQLSQHMDLTEKGVFQGHRGLVSLLGVLEGRPVVFSVDERSVMKLWDIRDFCCYQTFEVWKNVDFRQVIGLPEALCFVGSKHVCYRWQRFSEFQEAERIILVTQLQKDILIVTSKEVRLYSHSNGVLFKVLKGVFGNVHIAQAFLIEMRKILLVGNEEGEIRLYSTLDFSLLLTLHELPKPHSFYYEQQTELLTMVSMGEIRIYVMKELSDFSLKRRIYNDKEMIRHCYISAHHDFIAVQYDGPHLFFYSYERAKPIGFLLLDDLVQVELMPGKNTLLLLCRDKLLVMTFKKFLNSISFFLKRLVPLWDKQSLAIQNIKTIFPQPISTGFTVFDRTLIVTSTLTTLQCKLELNWSLLKQGITQTHKDAYNPYRVAYEDHLEAFQMNKPSLLIEESLSHLLQSQSYLHHAGESHNFQLLSKVNIFYCVSDDQGSTTFYDQQCHTRGIITAKETLPLNWDLHNYTEQQFTEFEFVLDFIQQEKQEKGQAEGVAVGVLAVNNEEIITLKMLSPTKKPRSSSLREKKMILEKERDERQKYQNFLEVMKGEQLLKLKQINRSTNEKYVSESLAFLNINRNKLLLSKGPQEAELPQIRTLQAKLNAAINRDEKKSMVSRYSHPFEQPSPAKKLPLPEETSKVKEEWLVQGKVGHESMRDHLRRLDLTLRQSKFQHKGRTSSLPFLRLSSNKI